MTFGEDDMKMWAAKAVREIDARRFTPAPVLNAHQWEVHYFLKKNLQNVRLQVLAGVGLSTFINPIGHSSYLDVLENSALFAVVTEPPHSSVVLLILEPDSQDIETILKEEGINWIRYAPLISAEEFSAEVSSLIPKLDISNKGGRATINYSEMSVKKLRIMSKTQLEKRS